MADDQQFIKVLRGKTEQRKYVLKKDSVLIGRNVNCDIRLGGPEISPIHLILQRAEDGCIVVKKGVRAVYVNGRETVQAVLAHGDEIQVGEYVFCYQRPDKAGVVAAARASAGGDDKKAEGAAGRSQVNRKWLLIGGYLSVMVLVVSVLVTMGDDGPQGPEPPSTRLEKLAAAYATSTLDNRDKIRELVALALLNEMRLEPEERLKLVNAAIGATVPPGSKPYDENDFLEDSLRLFVIDEVHRQLYLAEVGGN